MSSSSNVSASPPSWNPFSDQDGCNEMTLHFLSQCAFKEVLHCGRLNRRMCVLSKDPSLWSWLFARDFPGAKCAESLTPRETYRAFHVFSTNAFQGIYTRQRLYPDVKLEPHEKIVWAEVASDRNTLLGLTGFEAFLPSCAQIILYDIKKNTETRLSIAQTKINFVYSFGKHRLLMDCSWNNSFHSLVFDTESKEFIFRCSISVHLQPLRQNRMAFCDQTSLRVYDFTTNKTTLFFQEGFEPISSIHETEAGDLLTLSKANTLILWDSHKIQPKHTLRNVGSFLETRAGLIFYRCGDRIGVMSPKEPWNTRETELPLQFLSAHEFKEIEQGKILFSVTQTDSEIISRHCFHIHTMRLELPLPPLREGFCVSLYPSHQIGIANAHRAITLIPFKDTRPPVTLETATYACPTFLSPTQCIALPISGDPVLWNFDVSVEAALSHLAQELDKQKMFQDLQHKLLSVLKPEQLFLTSQPPQAQVTVFEQHLSSISDPALQQQVREWIDALKTIGALVSHSDLNSQWQHLPLAVRTAIRKKAAPSNPTGTTIRDYVKEKNPSFNAECPPPRQCKELVLEFPEHLL